MRWFQVRFFRTGLLVVAAFGASTGLAFADEPTSRIGRLFRLGGSPNPAPNPVTTTPAANPRPRSGSTPAAHAPAPMPSAPAVATPAFSDAVPGPRIAPQPRNAKPPTEADPIVTRIALGRSDNGSQFGMFLHVFADGTVIDSEGVHRVPGDALKPVVDALRSGEIYRQKGHCGGPATDFVEQVHMVVYDRNLGRLRATSFSYSGNTHGCDPSVKQIHAALDGLQARMAGAPAAPTAPQPAAVGSAPRGALPSIGLSAR